MGIVFSLVLFAIVSTAFLAYLGYGLVKLLLPRDWRSDEGLLAPLLGYVLLLLIGYYAVSTVLNLRQALFISLGLATLLNILALWLRRGERLTLSLREHGWAWLLAGLAFLLCILPLLNYGYVTIIGKNVDPEFYLPLAEYLVRVPVKDIAAMPPNPLRDLNTNPPRYGVAFGFSVVQGVLQQLVGWDALRSFAPTMALLRALAVLAFYLLFRRTLRMPQLPALLATALAALSSLALWGIYYNFGMQTSAVLLVPLGLLLLTGALREPSWRTVLAAGLAIAALPTAYYGALTAFGPMAAALWLYELAVARRRWAVLATGLGSVLLALALAWGPLLDYRRWFAPLYSAYYEKTPLGLTRIISWGEVLGFFPFALEREHGGAILPTLELVAVLLVVLLALTGLVRSRGRALWLALLLPALLYLLWLRGWLGQAATFLQGRGLLPALGKEVLDRLRPYPYGYMKGSVFVGPIALALASQGMWELRALGKRGRGTGITRALSFALIVFLAALTLWSTGRVVAQFWARPATFDRQALQVEEAVALLPPDTPVYLTHHPDRVGPISGLFAYFLREHPLRGYISAAYGSLAYCLPGEAYPYALLDLDDDPHPFGFSLEDRIWQGGGMALYRRDPAMASFLDLREGACPGPDARAAVVQSPLAMLSLAGSGECQQVSASVPLRLYADAAGLHLQESTAGPPSRSQILLAWASLAPAQALLHWDDGTQQQLGVPAGFSRYRTPAHPLPAWLEIAPVGSDPLSLCWAALLSDEQSAGWSTNPRVILLAPQVQVQEDRLRLKLAILNPGSRSLQAVLEIWENSFSSAQHYAWWGPLPLPQLGEIAVETDLSARQAYAWIDGRPVDLPAHPGAEAWPQAGDGAYFATLWVYYGQQAVQALPLARFDLQGGRVTALHSLPTPALTPAWPRPLSTPSGVRFGKTIELVAFERANGPFAPGELLPLALEWRSLAPAGQDFVVTAQIIHPAGGLLGQIDLPAGGEKHPTTTWQPGEEVRDDLPLRIAPDALRGRCRLIVALYDLASMQRLPVYSPDGQVLGDALDLGEIVIR